jgi:hypothetical protein
LVLVAGAAIGLPCADAAPASAARLGYSLTPSKTEPSLACGLPTPGHAECLSIVVPARSRQPLSKALPQSAGAEVGPALSGTGVGGGFSPADLRSAYGLPSESAGSGQTVAIVDAYDDPNAESDLVRYRSHYGIGACTSGNGCFKKVNQSGGATYPSPDPLWAFEISLDLDMVSAACPNCHIVLVEATTNSYENLFAAEGQAVALGATEISNSWGGAEFAGETGYDSYLNHLGLPITASAGDKGYEVEYPAASQYAIAVGGTSLVRAANPRGWAESAWSGTGSGCSAYEPKPTWQRDGGCPRRTNTDVSAVADTETPVSIADSYELPAGFAKPEAGWALAGGTSVASPLVAATLALSNPATRSFRADAFYRQGLRNGTGVLDDVLSGSNGSCGTYLCNAGSGFDGPTGLGSPYGAPSLLAEDIVAVEPEGSQSRYMTGLNESSGLAFTWEGTNLRPWTTPRAMALGDLNGDGKQDIVSVEPEGASQSRYAVGLSTGTGSTFTWQGTNLRPWTTPTQMTVGDLNGDGKADILAVEPEGASQSRYMVGLNEGSGISFNWQGTNLRPWTTPTAVALGDVNGDGKPDIVAVEPEGASQSRYMVGINEGSGISFNWQGTNLRPWTTPTKLAVGDVNGDGRADILAVEPEAGGTSRYMVGLSQPGGVSYVWQGTNLRPMTTPTAVALGDVNGDGKPDIVAVEPEGASQSRYMVGINEGSGISFLWQGTNLRPMTTPTAVAVGHIR